MTTPEWKAIIFDMDGLLVDSERVWLIGETEMLESRGHEYTREAREAIIGMRMDEFLVKLRDIFQIEDSVEVLDAELTARMLELIPEQVVAQPGAQELIDYVVAQRIPHAIASSSSLPIIDATLAAQGWANRFAIRCTAADEVNGKPAPDVYLTAARRLGFDPRECLALEDSPNGARAAVAAGMTCFAVPDKSHSTPVAFDGITPYVFDSLHDVLARIKG